MKRLLIPFVGLTVVVLVLGCSKPSATRSHSGWSSVTESALTESQRQQVQTAQAARDELFGRLMQRLETVTKTAGSAKAVVVCKDEAPQIAQSVAKEKNLRIGRTSFKLRNPANQPPDWASDGVQQRVAEPWFTAHSDGRLGVLLPIRLKDQCLVCHGSSEQVAEPVRAELATHYPNDRATGFAVGDLRGWFWVEVPPVEP